MKRLTYLSLMWFGLTCSSMAQDQTVIDDAVRQIDIAFHRIRVGEGTCEVKTRYPSYSKEQVEEMNHPLFGEAGKYSWYRDGSSSLMIKTVTLTHPMVAPSVQSKVLFVENGRQTLFTRGRTARGLWGNGDVINSDGYYYSPFFGYEVERKPISRLIEGLDNRSWKWIYRNGERLLFIQGTHGLRQTEIELSPRMGYLALNVKEQIRKGSASEEVVHTVTKAEQVDGRWMARDAAFVSTNFLDGNAISEIGYTIHLNEARFDLPPFDRSLAFPPKGAWITDQDKKEIYTADGNGKLTYLQKLGQKGDKPSVNYAGIIFNLCAATVVVSGSAWFVYRKR